MILPFHYIDSRKVRSLSYLRGLLGWMKICIQEVALEVVFSDICFFSPSFLPDHKRSQLQLGKGSVDCPHTRSTCWPISHWLYCSIFASISVYWVIKPYMIISGPQALFIGFLNA